MSTLALGPWEPLDLDEVVEIFSAAPFRWWVSGGHALDLHLGRSWRSHEDTDVGVVRSEAGGVWSLLAGWDLHVAAAGRLMPWHGRPLAPDRHENNVWCRRQATGPWIVDVTVGEGDDLDWIYRRDPAVRVPWAHAVLWSDDGIPYLAPDLQLLFKSKAPRPKDEIDAAEVIPELDARRRARLARQLHVDHPWRRLLR